MWQGYWGAVVRAAELAEVLDLEIPERKSERRLRASPAKVFALPASTAPTTWVQGNWKRRTGVATRYELALAIDRLLERGKLEIDTAGMLRLACGKRRTATTREERWARDDAALEAWCQRIDVHETRSKRIVDYAGLQGSSFEASVFHSEPRRGVGKYVLRELRNAGALDYESVIRIIDETGGLEWTLEPPRKSYRKGAKR